MFITIIDNILPGYNSNKNIIVINYRYKILVHRFCNQILYIGISIYRFVFEPFICLLYTSIPFDKLSVYNAVYPYKNVSILNSDGTVCENRIYQMRDDGENRWLFIANGVCPSEQQLDLPTPQDVKITVFGNEYDVEVYDLSLIHI